MRAALLLFACTLAAHAQWQILDAHTAADLRGIDNVGKGVVWASGTHGTVLRSEDNGTTWQHCTVPPDTDKLDFRGIQAFDANTTIVMSSGKGDLSRLYKTTDGCQTWKLMFTNPDKDGFWDAVLISWQKTNGVPDFLVSVVGDPVNGRFTSFSVNEIHPAIGPPFLLIRPANYSNCSSFNNLIYSGTYLQLPPRQCTDDGVPQLPEVPPLPQTGESLFAASNTSMLDSVDFVTGGPQGARFISQYWQTGGDTAWERWITAELPLAKSSSAGAFSVAARELGSKQMVVVGGDYLKPNDSFGTAAFTTDGGKTWTASFIPPHGYRSAVAYDSATKTWITVGPNGTDISTDDGRNWRALKPGPGDAPDADQHWNALSLPFVVGPKGRIGMLEAGALKGK